MLRAQALPRLALHACRGGGGRACAGQQQLQHHILAAWQQEHQQQHPGSLWPSQRQFHATHQLWQQQQQQSQQSQQQPKQQRSTAVLKLYTGKWILPVRFLVRAKVFQLFGGGGIVLLLAAVMMDEAATTAHIAGMTGLAVGMAVVSCCLWYYSRRYVGEMALLMPDAQRVRFSVLDFWGNREEVVVPLAAMKPPFKGVRKQEVERLANQILFPVTVEGDRQYYLSIHAGRLLEPQVFMSMMKGEFRPQDHPPVTAAQQHWQQVLQPQRQQQQQQQQAASQHTIDQQPRVAEQPAQVQ